MSRESSRARAVDTAKRKERERERERKGERDRESVKKGHKGKQDSFMVLNFTSEYGSQ